MNLYLLSFFIKLPNGEIRGGTQTIAATSATMAVLQLEALPLPGTRVGGVSWTLIGPRIAPPRPLARHDLSPLRRMAA